MADTAVSNNFFRCQRAPATDVAFLEARRHVWQPKIQRVHVTENGCFEFSGGKNSAGYGVVSLGVIAYKKSKLEYAHRLSFYLHNGFIPSDLVIDHKCGNRACINPSHLQAIAHEENARQGARKSRKSHCGKCGEKKELRRLPSGDRMICVPCSRKRSRLYKLRIKAAKQGT